MKEVWPLSVPVEKVWPLFLSILMKEVWLLYLSVNSDGCGLSIRSSEEGVASVSVSVR